MRDVEKVRKGVRVTTAGAAARGARRRAAGRAMCRVRAIEAIAAVVEVGGSEEAGGWISELVGWWFWGIRGAEE